MRFHFSTSQFPAPQLVNFIPFCFCIVAMGNLANGASLILPNSPACKSFGLKTVSTRTKFCSSAKVSISSVIGSGSAENKPIARFASPIPPHLQGSSMGEPATQFSIIQTSLNRDRDVSHACLLSRAATSNRRYFRSGGGFLPLLFGRLLHESYGSKNFSYTKGYFSVRYRTRLGAPAAGQASNFFFLEGRRM